MAVEQRSEVVPTSAVAVVVSTLSPEALDAHIAKMGVEDLVQFTLRVKALAALAAKSKKLAIAALTAKGQSQAVFNDPADGTPYQFTGGRHRRIKDVRGFVEQLAADGIDARPLVPWLASDAFKVGADIEGDQRIKDAVKEWATWVDDALDLVELDPRTMKPVKR